MFLLYLGFYGLLFWGLLALWMFIDSLIVASGRKK